MAATTQKIAVELVAKVDGLNAAFRTAGQSAEAAAGKMRNAFSGSAFDAIGKSSTLAAGSMQKMAMSANAYNAALRNVPAQITDIVVGLQAGQKPFTVLLQQGGQLKDMFGGIVPAAKALGGQVARMITPFNLLAAAVAGYGYAAYAGDEETRAFTRTLILSGNAAGVTADKLIDISRAVSVATGATRGNVSETLTMLAASGKVTGDQLENVTAVITRMSRAGGVEAEKMVEAFVALGKEPVAASLKLNDTYNYLTASTYRQIRALEDQGRHIEAVDLAQKAFADASDGMAAKLEKNLGILEKLWRGLKNTASGAWDAMLGIGRDKSASEQLSAIEKQIKVIEERSSRRGKGPLNVFSPGALQDTQEIERLKAQSAALGEILVGEQASAANLKYENELKREGLAWEKQLADARAKNLTIDEKIKNVRAQGAKLNRPKEETDAIVAALEKQREKGAKVAKTAREQDSAFQKLAQTLKEKIAVQTEELSVSEKLTGAAKEYAKFKMQVEGGAIKLSGDELAAAEKLWAQYLDGAERMKAKAQDKAYEAARSTITALSDAFARDNAVKLSGFAVMSDTAREKFAALAAVEEKARQERERFAEAELRGNISTEQRIKLTDELTAAIQKQKDEVGKFYVLQEKLNASFEYGAAKGLQSYLDDVANVAKSSEQLITDAFKGMEDALVNFVQTGKLDFKSLVNSMLADMARLAIRQNITGPFAQWMKGGSGGSFDFSSLFGSVFGSSSSMASAMFNEGMFFADGGVLKSPSLSAYSGQIVDRPTLFKFASGAGLMGEAGAEAILPLKRGSNGKLGVQAGGGVSPVINITINGNNNAPDVRRAAGQGAREALAAFNGAQRYA